MENEPNPRAMPSQSAMGFYLAAGRQKALRDAHLGPDAIGKHSTNTPDALKAFLKEEPDLAKEFLSRAQIDESKLSEALEQPYESEPDPDPPRLRENPTEEQRERFEDAVKREQERLKEGKAPPMSRPMKASLQAARTKATEAGQRNFTFGALAAAMLTGEGVAATIIRDLADPEALSSALEWLESQDGASKGMTMDSIKANMRATLDRMWPQIRAQSQNKGTDKWRAQRDEEYEESPSKYEEPLDIAARLAERQMPPDQDYTWRAGVCLHAARNEARIRRAPEATLDHMLFALLRDGTDTAAFLDARGVDRQAWQQRLDESLPRFEDGPLFPENARDLGMSIPSNTGIEIKEEIPEDLDLSKLTPEERRTYAERTIDSDKRFTDLKYLINYPDELATTGYALFEEAGVTLDDLRAAIKERETGDADWWKKRPDLIKAVDESKHDRLTTLRRTRPYAEAAQFEARLRHAPQIEFEDFVLALCIPGTDLAALCVDRGIDLDELPRGIHALLPFHDRGPYFPEPDSGSHVTFTGLGWEPFSDLLFIANAYDSARNFRETPPASLKVLEDLGITEDVVLAKLEVLGVRRVNRGKGA